MGYLRANHGVPPIRSAEKRISQSLTTVSATRAPRRPSGFEGPSVVSRAV
jgi:hypothetical protein